MNLESLRGLYDFTGKSVMVTGGAGVLAGEMACALFGCNAQIAIVDRDPSLAGPLMKRIEPVGDRAIVVFGDVLKAETMRSAAESVIRSFGKIDMLINAAGGNDPRATSGAERTFFDIPPDALKFVSDLNLLGTMIPSQIVGKHMAERKEGVILNVSSMNAFRPLTRIPAYSAAKAAVSNFTQWLAVYMAQEMSPASTTSTLPPATETRNCTSAPGWPATVKISSSPPRPASAPIRKPMTSSIARWKDCGWTAWTSSNCTTW